MSAKAVLCSPPRGGKRKRYTVSALLKSHLQQWQNGCLVSLWEEVRSKAGQQSKSTSYVNTDRSLKQSNARRATFLAREGRYGDAARSLQSQGCASENDSDALQDLINRHPLHPLPSWCDELPPALCATASHVLESLKGFPLGNSPGFSKLRPQHLLDAIVGTCTPAAQECLDRLTQWMNVAVSGKMDRRIAPFMTGAPLAALFKKEGQGVRPIVVGETLRRLVSWVCCLVVRSKLPDILLPYGQVGTGIKSGMEAAIHRLSKFIDDHGQDPSLCCVKIDMSNAFNNCFRDSFLLRLRKELPEIYSCYHSKGELRFGNHRLQSSGGVQQGDPLGPLLFSLVALELMDDIGSAGKVPLQLWYLDDGMFIGPRPAIAQLFHLLQSRGPSFALLLNPTKCEVFRPSGDQKFSEFPSEVQRIVGSVGGVEFLGSPVFGSEEYYCGHIAKRVDKVLQCQEKLLNLDDPQIQLLLLRSCLSSCKINNLLRTVPPNKGIQ